MPETLTLYGLYGFSHGWARILTVMSPQGAGATVAAVKPGDGVVLKTGAGMLPQFHEQREGALDRLVERHGITILDRTEWNARKARIGEGAYR